MSSQPDNAEYFSTPAIYHAGMCEAEWQWELDQMIQRAHLTRAFVDGEISPDDYMDGLDELRIDVIQAAEDWEAGKTYL